MDDLHLLIQFVRNYGYWFVGIGIFLECMGIPFPGETSLMLGGVAASLGHLNLAIVIVIAAFSAVMGDNMGYFVGKRYGRKIIKKLEKLPLFKPEHVHRAEEFFEKYGNKTVFIGRFTAILRTYSALFAGIFDMPYTSFFIYNLSGGVLWAIIYGYVGFYIGNNLPLLGKVILDFNIVIFVAVGLFIAWKIAQSLSAKKKANQEKALGEKHKVGENIMQTSQQEVGKQDQSGIKPAPNTHQTHKTAAPIMHPKEPQDRD